MKIKFTEKESSRGWAFKQGTLNVDKFFSEKRINRACADAAKEISKLINKNKEEKGKQQCLI